MTLAVCAQLSHKIAIYIVVADAILKICTQIFGIVVHACIKSKVDHC